MPSTLPAGPRSTVFRTFVGWLRNDPILSEYVTTWRVWTGDVGEAGPPVLEQYPWVRISPRPEKSIRSYTDAGGRPVHSMPMLIQIDTATEGSDQDASMDLWDAIEDAIFGVGAAGKAARRAEWTSLGIACIDVLKPCYGIENPEALEDPEKGGEAMARGEPGLIKIDMDFYT